MSQQYYNIILLYITLYIIIYNINYNIGSCPNHINYIVTLFYIL